MAINDNTAKWKVRKLTNFASNVALPVGHIYQSLSKTVPVGSLPLLGGEYDRTLYADLWSWANENGLVVSESEWQVEATAQGGSCSKFSDGNGSTTFRVPALKCWVKGANGVKEVGGYIEAGLPNIIGELILNPDSSNAGMDATGTGTGAIVSTDCSGSGSNPDATDWTVWKGFTFDASRSNPIYGNSDTVQPPSIVAMYCIVAYGTITNISDIDVAEYTKVVNRVSDRQEAVLRSFSTDGHLVLPDGSEFWIA